MRRISAIAASLLVMFVAVSPAAAGGSSIADIFLAAQDDRAHRTHRVVVLESGRVAILHAGARATPKHGRAGQRLEAGRAHRDRVRSPRFRTHPGRVGHFRSDRFRSDRFASDRFRSEGRATRPGFERRAHGAVRGGRIGHLPRRAHRDLHLGQRRGAVARGHRLSVRDRAGFRPHSGQRAGHASRGRHRR